MSVQVFQPVEIFYDINGKPLDDGFIWVGQPNLDPETNQISVFFDELLTIPAAQPIRTRNGFPANAGVQAQIFVAETTFSITIKNKNSTVIRSVAAVHSSSDLEGRLRDPVNPLNGATIVSFIPSPSTGFVGRASRQKLQEIPNVKDRGAAGNGVADDAPEAQAAIVAGRLHFPSGVYLLGTSLAYRKDHLVTGEGKSFGGSFLRPSGNFPAFIHSVEVPAIDSGKNTFKDIHIDCVNITSDYAWKINNSFTTEYVDIWVRNSFNGFLIENSDSLNFSNVMIMEDSNNDAVVVGDNARSIRFFGCNFEKNPGNVNPGGTVRVDGDGAATISSADFIGCQIERGRLIVGDGTARWDGGKLTDCPVVFGERASDCWVSADMYGSTSIFDIGYNTNVINAHCQNMATRLHQWPALAEAVAGTNTFGAAGDEFMYLITAGRRESTAGVGVLIEIKEGATVLASSPAFNLRAMGLTTGLNKKPTYTFLSCVRNSAAASGPVVTGARIFSQNGGKSVLTNGTFDAGTTTGWTLNSVVAAASGDDVLLTPSASNWSISQAIDTKFKKGKRYIVAAKFTGVAQLVLGAASDGTDGARSLINSGQTGIYDSDTIAMLSFEYTGQTPVLSLGALGSSSVVTVRWIAAIEC